MFEFISFIIVVGFFVVVGMTIASPYASFGLLALAGLMSLSFLGLGYLMGSDDTRKYGLFSTYYQKLDNMIDERIKLFQDKK